MIASTGPIHIIFYLPVHTRVVGVSKEVYILIPRRRVEYSDGKVALDYLGIYNDRGKYPILQERAWDL